MRFRTTLILVLVLAVLGLTVWMWPDVEEVDDGEIARLFPDFERERAEKLVLSPAGGQELVIERSEDGRWEITQPFRAEADDEFVDQVLRDLATSYRYEEPRAGAPADYGLAEPRFVLSFRLEGGEERRIEFGNVDTRRRDQPDVFVQIDDDDTIHRTQRSLFETLDQQVDELRERSVISPRLLSLFDVHRLEIHQDDRVLVARQVAGQWELEEPIVASADTPKVRALISTFLMMQIDRFVADQGADLARYGLADPRGRVRLASGDGPEATAVIVRVGADDPEKKGNVFVSVEGRGSVYSVIDDQGSLRPDVTEAVQMTASHLRDPRVFGAPIRYATDRVEVEGPGERHWVLEKRELAWHITEPIERIADTDSVGQLLTVLDEAKFESFMPAGDDLAQHGLADPAVTIHLTHGDPPLTTIVHLSPLDADGRFVLREEPRALGRVEAGTFDYLDNGFWPYIERPFWELDEDDLTRLVVEVEGSERSFTRGESGWETGSVPATALEAAVGRLVELAGEEVFERQTEQGLESPVARVTLETRDGEKVLLIGAERPGGDELRFAALESAPESKTIPADLVDDLRGLVQ